jgi:hypothetical protein
MKTKEFITKETWVEACKIISVMTPACRVEVAMSGEPTLHPDLTTLLWMGRKLTPYSQFNIITNGTMITKGKVTYRDLFRAGANVIYVDMYAPREKHIELAKASGYQWVEVVEAPATMAPGMPSPWAYHGPHIKLIALAYPPEHWSKSTAKRGRMGTWLGRLDWKAAEKHGMQRLKAPLQRRCNQPFRHVSTKANGEYALCCVDFHGESREHNYGSVYDGVEGFKRFWMGKKMQNVRRMLHKGNRAGVKECARCDIVFGRADIVWPEKSMRSYWSGKKWKEA